MHATFGHSAGGVVVSSQGAVLLVQQPDGSWSLPKGHVVDGEELLDAAMREIVEETGLTDLHHVKILGSYSRYSLLDTGKEDTESMKRITMYLFQTSQEDLRPIDAKVRQAVWVEPGKVRDMLTHPKDQEFFAGIVPEIEDYLQIGRNPEKEV